MLWFKNKICTRLANHSSIEIGLYDQNKYVSKYFGQAKNDLKATKLNKRSIQLRNEQNYVCWKI